MQQHSSSSTSAAFQALTPVPVVTVYVCVVAARQEMEPRQHSQVRCGIQTPFVGPHTRCLVYEALSNTKNNSSCYNWNSCVHHVQLSTPPGDQVTSRRGTLYHYIRYSCFEALAPDFSLGCNKVVALAILGAPLLQAGVVSSAAVQPPVHGPPPPFVGVRGPPAAGLPGH